MKRGEQFYGNCNIVTTQKKLHEISLEDSKGHPRPDEEVLDDIYKVLMNEDRIATDAYTEEEELQEERLLDE